MVAQGPQSRVVRQPRLEVGSDILPVRKSGRFDLCKRFRRDLDSFYFAARQIERFSPASRRLRPLVRDGGFTHAISTGASVAVSTPSSATPAAP